MPAAEPSPPTILVVDDDRILTTMFARLLAGVGKVVTANSGADGLALARSVMPDLILLDVQMPGQDGFDTIAELKTDPMVRHIPVIFITADTLPEIESHCLESGAADYIAKPVNPRVLQARARTHLLLKAQADMLAELAVRDLVTGAHNDAAFREMLGSECARAAWKGREITLIRADMDQFPDYIRRYGNIAGDDVVTAIVAAMAPVAANPGEIIGRLGSDEFAVLLPETAASTATQVAERIRVAVHGLGIRNRGSRAGVVTISAGVATGSGASIGAESMMTAAQAALDRARAAGGDCVRTA
jgi:diguanylate cyclase (GGDEF)-like protein